MASETSIESEEQTVFEIANQEDTNTVEINSAAQLFELEQEPFIKRAKTNILTYFRHNYLSIIKVLIVVVSFLLVALITQYIYLNSRTIGASALPQTSSNIIKKTEDVTKTSCGKINCRTVKPKDLLCYIDSTRYQSIRVYTCCDCLPPGFTFVRYLKDRRMGSTALLFRVDQVTPAALSDLDLEVLPRLKNLRGIWNVVEDSDVVNWLSFTISGFDTPPEEE